MSNGFQYTGLICSLPACDALFSAKRTPITRFQLQQRFKELEPQDATDIAYLANVLDWFAQPTERRDEELLQLFEKNLSLIQNVDIQSMLKWRMEFRTVIGALRQRHNGARLPEQRWGYGRWLPLIKKHWSEPNLGLEKLLPWSVEVLSLLKEEQAMKLERLILSLVWDWLERLSWEHRFDLAAVAIYRMRWDLISRWVCYAQEPAQKRFTHMVEDIIQDQFAIA